MFGKIIVNIMDEVFAWFHLVNYAVEEEESERRRCDSRMIVPWRCMRPHRVWKLLTRRRHKNFSSRYWSMNYSTMRDACEAHEFILLARVVNEEIKLFVFLGVFVLMDSDSIIWLFGSSLKCKWIDAINHKSAYLSPTRTQFSPRRLSREWCDASWSSPLRLGSREILMLWN